MGKSTDLARHRKTGKIVSKRSKTGEPMCSQAMSIWKREGMSPAIAKTLAHCRQLAKGHREADLHRLGGREARAQALEHRIKSGTPLARQERHEVAQGVQQQRRAAAARRLEKSRPKPAPEPKPSGGFSLRQESAHGRKKTNYEATGAGKTGFMFDMKKGDIKGQTTLMDKFGTVETMGTGKASSHTVEAAAARKARLDRAAKALGMDPNSLSRQFVTGKRKTDLMIKRKQLELRSGATRGRTQGNRPARGPAPRQPEGAAIGAGEDAGRRSPSPQGPPARTRPASPRTCHQEGHAGARGKGNSGVGNVQSGRQ